MSPTPENAPAVMPQRTPSVLLIGTSRGLGLAITREYATRGASAVATVRGTPPDELLELEAASEGRLEIEHVDITELEQVRALHDRLSARVFDLLFVIAGVTNGPEETVVTVTTDEFHRLMDTNALSPLRVIEVLGDLVDPSGTIAVMSSGQGSIANNERGGFEVYRASKSALNQLMRSYAARSGGDRTLLLMAPGWVKTDLGGPDAKLTVDESVPGVATTIEQQRGRHGLQFLDYQGRTVAW